jgi:beta-lactam-binding protein with PASTA domain
MMRSAEASRAKLRRQTHKIRRAKKSDGKKKNNVLRCEPIFGEVRHTGER